MSHRRSFLACIALLLVCLCAPVAACGDGEPAPAADDEHVRVVVLPYLTFAPFHVAAQEGLFAEQGLDVEFIRLSRNQEIMTALARGDVDVAAGMLTVNELNLAARGARVRMVAALGDLVPDHCTFAAFVVRREHAESGALEDPDRLRELRFDIDPLLPLGYWTDLLLAPMGLTMDDVEIAYVPPPATVEAIRNATIDVTMESEPFVGMLEATEEAVLWKQVGELVPGYVITMMMYGPDFLDQRPELGERFAVAMLKAVRRYREGKTPRNLAIVQEATGLTRQQVATACWPHMSADARIDPSLFRDYQEWSVRHGLVERVLPEEELFDPRFIDHANAVLGPEDGDRAGPGRVHREEIERDPA